MKKVFLTAAAVAAMIPSAFAARTVSMVPVVDLAVVTPGAINSATYVPDGGVPGADKFLTYSATSVLPPAVYNTAGTQQGTLPSTGVAPSGGQGFFALTAGVDGVIYGFENGAVDIWKWDSFSDSTPIKAYDTPLGFQRVGSVGGTGINTVLAFTGNATAGKVEFFSGSAPFTSSETPTLLGKSGLAINTAGDVAFTVADTGLKIRKFVKTGGVWAEDTANWIIPGPIGAGALTYDSVNNVLFSSPQAGSINGKVYAYDGLTGGVPIGELTFTNLQGTVPANCGGVAVPNGPGGTVGFAARGAATTATAVFRKLTYTVTPDASVSDWTLY